MNREAITIGGKRVGPGEPPFVIAEIGQAHDGSLGMAHAFVDAVAGVGADAIKFQTHIAGAESTLDEPFRVKFSRQDVTRYAYWMRMEFTEEQWGGLAEHARAKGLVFLSSPFSVPAVALLRRLGVAAWKVGSGETANRQLLDAMTSDGRPVLLSTGMSTIAEIEESHRHLRDQGTPQALLQCTSRYPTVLEEVGINVLDEFRARFACPVGLSDHSGSVFPSLAAMARGADLIEVHVTFDRRMFGPDSVASVTLEELGRLVDARRSFHVMATHPVDKDEMSQRLAQTRALFTKSVAVERELEAGTVLTVDMLTLKKPGTGIPAREIELLVGRRIGRRVVPDRLLTYEDLDDKS